MPELPEVETLVRGLRKQVMGRTILSVHLRKTDFMDNPVEIQRDLPGLTIQSIARRGKFFYLTLANSHGAARNLFVHLGMTGHLATYVPAEPEKKHTHLVAGLDDGRELRYTDPRRFGRIALFTMEQFQGVLSEAGAEPLNISAKEFQRRLRGRAARIKALLLDQRTLGGIGNIYADESLWHARIHPAQRASRLAPARLEALRRAIQKVLRAAIAHKGSSISDYRDASGQPGWFQLRHRVYDREGEPCFRCRAKIRRTIVAGRGTSFCPRCQRAPRRNN